MIRRHGPPEYEDPTCIGQIISGSKHMSGVCVFPFLFNLAEDGCRRRAHSVFAFAKTMLSRMWTCSISKRVSIVAFTLLSKLIPGAGGGEQTLCMYAEY